MLILGRFDEVMSTKASKISVEEISKRLDNYLTVSARVYIDLQIHNLTYFYIQINVYKIDQKTQEQRTQDFIKSSENLEKSFKALENVVAVEISSAVRKAIKNLKNDIFVKMSPANQGKSLS